MPVGEDYVGDDPGHGGGVGGGLPGGGGGWGGGSPGMPGASGTLSLPALLAMRRNMRGGAPGQGPAEQDGGQEYDPMAHLGLLLHEVMAYADGGMVNEPVIGRGQWSKRPYMFGEAGPEQVTPMGGGDGWGSQRQPAPQPGTGQRGMFGEDEYLQAILDHMESLGLANQGAASRAAAYYGANEGPGGGGGGAGYAQLGSLLQSQGRTASSVNDAYLQKLFRDQDQYRKRDLIRLGADVQPDEGVDYGGILGGVGTLVGGIGSLFGEKKKK